MKLLSFPKVEGFANFCVEKIDISYCNLNYFPALEYLKIFLFNSFYSGV